MRIKSAAPALFIGKYRQRLVIPELRPVPEAGRLPDLSAIQDPIGSSPGDPAGVLFRCGDCGRSFRQGKARAHIYQGKNQQYGKQFPRMQFPPTSGRNQV